MRAQRHRIARLNRAICDCRCHAERRRKLALRSGDDRHQLAGGHLHHVLGTQRMPLGMVSRPRSCAMSVSLIAAAPKDRLAPVFLCQVRNLLQAMNGGAEAGDHPDAAASTNKSSSRGHRALAFRCSRAGRRYSNPTSAAGRRACVVGAVGQKSSISGRGVDFESRYEWYLAAW